MTGPTEPSPARRAWTAIGAPFRDQHHRSIAYLAGLIIVLFLVDFLWSGHTADTARRQSEHATGLAAAAQHRALVGTNRSLDASCDFWHDLGGLSPTPGTPGHPPALLGTEIIVHSRASFLGQHCPGTLAPAGPALMKSARYYHLNPN